uniref:Uncharacterized protein n=1 Tax=Anguilla anguilla TaxID=7936 RepID=A0A0E9R6I9_ANGAN
MDGLLHNNQCFVLTWGYGKWKVRLHWWRHSSGGKSSCLAVGGLPVRSPALGVSKCP